MAGPRFLLVMSATTAQKFLAAAVADLLRPVHPIVLAQSEKVPRIFIRREALVVNKVTFMVNFFDELGRKVPPAKN